MIGSNKREAPLKSGSISQLFKLTLTEKQCAFLVGFILLVCYAYFFPRWADWNQNSRMNLTRAVVEQGTIRIDDYYQNTGDYAVYDGHVYTDKAPGTSFLGVPAYALFRAVAGSSPGQAILQRVGNSDALAQTLKEDGTGLLEDKVFYAAALYCTTLATVSLPSAFLGALLFLFMGRFMTAMLPRVGLVLAYGLATVVFPYSTVFYGHQIGAVLLFCVFYLLYRMRYGEINTNWLWFVGGLLGLGVLIEFTALIPLLILGLYALWFLERKWEIIKLGLGGVPFALILGWYNNAAFGSPFASSYRYLALFSEISNTGFLGFTRPSFEALWGVTFSPYRGLFFLSPFLLLVIPGFWYLLRNRQWRAEGILWLALCIGQLLLISAWFDWRGGFAIGPRNLLTPLPFAIQAVAYCLYTWRDKPMPQLLSWGLVVISFLLVGVASVSGQDFAPIVINNPLVEFFWPKFRAGDITRNLGMALGLSSWFSLLPLLIILGGTLWIVQKNGRPWRSQP